jgi:hypothetical protein
MPRRTRKPIERALTRTPAAAATSGSTEANSSRRPIMASTASAARLSTSRTRTCPLVMPRKFPNSRLVRPLRFPAYSETNRNPLASAIACTVPISADSSRYVVAEADPEPELEAAPITSAAPMQKPK